ncbi:hypothetical protein Dip518_000757 [Parelusimicrobium proximum]|uniref:hypothetical protein n=1 Tax=Parelusimicrobium proximum TaxID=3228953 RepID=UPI003D16BC47
MNIIIAAVFCLVASGAGQIYNGQIFKGIIFAFIFALGKSFLLPLALRFFKDKEQVKALKFIFGFNIFYILIIFVSVADAVYFSFNKSFEWRNFIFAFLSSLAIISVRVNTLEKNIFAMLAGRADLFEYVKPNAKK